MWGTCWILNKCDDDINSYHYYCGTNLHVQYPAFSDSSHEINGYWYSDIRDEWFSVENYNHFVDGDISIISEYLTFSNDSEPEDVKKDNSIDFTILDVNFSNANGSFKRKLDKINSFYAEYGYVNKFCNTTRNLITSAYCAGFPMHDKEDGSIGTKFCYEHLTNLELIKGDSRYYHSINDDDNYKLYVDVSNNYKSTKHYKNFTLTGGSSGSMLINNDYEIIAIYWGGWAYEVLGEQFFVPSFSIFHSENYSFIEQYIK